MILPDLRRLLIALTSSRESRCAAIAKRPLRTPHLPRASRLPRAPSVQRPQIVGAYRKHCAPTRARRPRPPQRCQDRARRRQRSRTSARCANSSAPRGSGAGSRESAMPIRASTGLSTAVSKNVTNPSIAPTRSTATALARSADRDQVRRDRVSGAIDDVAFDRGERALRRARPADSPKTALASATRVGRPKNDGGVGDASAHAIEHRIRERWRPTRADPECSGSKSRSGTGAPSNDVNVSRTPLATTQAALAGSEERRSKRASLTRFPVPASLGRGAAKPATSFDEIHRSLSEVRL